MQKPKFKPGDVVVTWEETLRMDTNFVGCPVTIHRLVDDDPGVRATYGCYRYYIKGKNGRLDYWARESQMKFYDPIGNIKTVKDIEDYLMDQINESKR